MKHGALVQQVLIHVSRLGWRMFKNAVGSAWHGYVTEEYMISNKKGDHKVIELHKAYKINYGLQPGSSNLVGYRTVKIRPEDVGKRLAQFCAVECKTGQYALVTEEQRNFLSQVQKAGGYAAIATMRSEEIEMEVV